MDLVELRRAQLAGPDFEQAAFFAQIAGSFEEMLKCQLEIGDVGEALRATERARARTLLDQLERQGFDPLAGMPAEQSNVLRRRLAETHGRVSSLRARLQGLRDSRALSDEQFKEKHTTLQTELVEAEEDHVKAYIDVRNAGAGLQGMAGQLLKTIDLDTLQQFLTRENSLLLEYHLGVEGGYLLVVPPGPTQPRLERLTVAADQAQTLGIEPGSLTSAQLQKAFSNRAGDGVLQLLRMPGQGADARRRLSALWTMLIPEAERHALTDGTVGRLIVVPDGSLSLLPFETLVVDDNAEPRYLLDVGPPIVYQPSATVLHYLATRPAADRPTNREPVLTVGNPRYSEFPNRPVRTLAEEFTPNSRYRDAGGRLSPLPNSARETNWVAEVYRNQRVSVTQLQGNAATEANIRAAVEHRRIVHVACHGLVDQRWGNLFGALALTSSTNSADGPSNDGFLNLTEIHDLKLNGCELAILSACETNYGPEQRGEGVWGLSRGFLIAGSRRVVASNWLVDDEAAASLISYFCGGIAQAEGRGEAPDYARSLHETKRWVRSEPKWQSPFYWASFVLMGPN